jgi:hypothetical protein
MKTDALKLYRTLQQRLQNEKVQIEARLRKINDALAPGLKLNALGVQRTIRGRPGGNPISLREAVLRATAERSLTRQEIVSAVQKLGYVFGGKNPLNQLGVWLYGKKSIVRNEGGKFIAKAAQAATSRPKRQMSAAAKEKIAAAQRRRWARFRSTKKT